MKRIKNKFLYGAFSLSAGLTSAVLPGCAGSNCASCFGCAAPGIGILLLLAFTPRREQKNGMA